MKVKESLATSILAPIFTVLLVFIFLIGANIYYLNDNFFNTKKFVKNIAIEELIEDIKDDLIEENDSTFGVDSREYEEVLDVVFEKEFLDLALSEIWEAEFYGDEKIDRKALEKAFDNATEDYFEENSDRYSSDDVDELRDELIDSLESEVYDTATSDIDEGMREIFSKMRDYSTKILYILIFVAVVLIGVLVLIHKNKARVLIYTGISMTISQAINLAGTAGLASLVMAAMSEAPSDDEMVVDFITGVFKRFTTSAVTTFGMLLILGIVLIVLGNVLSKSLTEVDDIE